MSRTFDFSKTVGVTGELRKDGRRGGGGLRGLRSECGRRGRSRSDRSKSALGVQDIGIRRTVRSFLILWETIFPC